MLTPKVKFVEYNERHKEALCQMIYNLYTEDPEGEPMDEWTTYRIAGDTLKKMAE